MGNIDRIIEDCRNKEPTIFICPPGQCFMYRSMTLPQVVYALLQGGVITGEDYCSEHCLNLGKGDVLFFDDYPLCDSILVNPKGIFSDLHFMDDRDIFLRKTGIDIGEIKYFKSAFLLGADLTVSGVEFYPVRGHIFASNGPFPLNQFSEQSRGLIRTALDIKEGHPYHELV